MLVGALVWWGIADGPERAALPGGTDVSSASGESGGDARELVERLGDAWRTGDVAAARRLTGSPGRGAILDITRNLRDLQPAELSLRYLTEDPLGPAVSDGRNASLVTAQLTWRLDRDGPATAELPLQVAERGGELRIVSLQTATADRLPLWVQSRVSVRRTPQSLLVTSRSPNELAGQVAEAVRTVRAVFPRWRGLLVVEAPRTRAEFETATGLAAAEVAAIAAVTTTADGTGGPTALTQVYLNPPVFDPLGAEARQIVLSHEATHVATDALVETAPYWLSEGFADYVALADSDLPTSVLAAQVLALVREDGAPRRLPGRVEFDGANEDIGAWYEAAWVAVDLIAERYGEAVLLEFYDRAAQDGERVAFREVLDSTRREFTRAWSAHLTELAR